MIKLKGKTKKEIKENKEKEEWEFLRRKRNDLLKETDYLMMEDYPISKENKDKIKEYRKKLRDLTELYKNPFEIIFPEKPFFF